MTWQAAAWLLLGGSTALMFLGLPVAFAFLAINLLGAAIFLGGDAGMMQLARNSVQSVTSFALTPIPLFILMGEVLFHTGLAVKVIDGIERLVREVPSVMLARGYHPTLATGPIMAIGAVDMLIPPSALTVLLGSLSGISISKLLVGGIVPGLILSAIFVGYIVLRVKMEPALAPKTAFEEFHGWRRLQPFLQYVLPLVSIFIVVVGAMIAGWATPTECAALGAFATIVLALLYRVLTLENLLRALRGTAGISGMILFIIVGATTFSQILSFSGASNGLAQAITGLGLPPLAVVAGMMLFLIFLGVFVEQVSMMMITLPIFMPIVQQMGIDPVWFGVMFLICMQLGLLMPPHGLLLMTMKGVAPPQVTMMHIFRAVTPFLLISFVVLALVFLVPSLAVWLPNLVG
jgi:tripartite ATP-independent transporter DctM subunit